MKFWFGVSELISCLDELSIGKMIGHALIKIALAGPGVDGELGIGRESIGSNAWIEQLNVHNAAILVMPRACVFVSQANVHRQFRRDLPVILYVPIEGTRSQQGNRRGDGAGRVIDLAKHIVGERESGVSSRGRIECRGSGEIEFTGGFLIAELIVAIAPDLTAEPEGMSTANDGNIVHKLERVIPGAPGVGSAKSGDTLPDTDGRHAVCGWADSVQSGDLQLSGNIAVVGKSMRYVVEKLVVPKPEFIHSERTEDSGIREDLLFHVRRRDRVVAREHRGGG